MALEPVCGYILYMYHGSMSANTKFVSTGQSILTVL